MSVAIKLENISKQYRLGQVGTGTISHDLNRWWHRVRGKEDPYSQVGQINRRDQAAESEYVWALKDINLEVEQGEVLGIIGANGAGKSTLLKLISRITSPTTGAIKAKGRIASLLEVGTGFHPEMTARENIYLNGSILGMRRHEITRKFDEIIDFAGCRMYVDTPVKRYSSGMHVRLAFAVAAFLEPEILIVDEVLAVGDAEFQKRAIGKMQEVSQGGGRTVLFVSHNLASVEMLCTKTSIIACGQITPPQNTREAIAEYRTQSLAHISESSHTYHNPNGIVTRVELLDTASQPTTDLSLGSAITIHVHLASNKIPDSALIGLGFDHTAGERAFTIHCPRESVLKSSRDTTILTCSIPHLPLPPGDYTVKYALSSFSSEVESEEKALAFSVLDSKRSGHPSAFHRGHCFAHSEWMSS
ncbi:ABC transporter ATP-binding protein [Rubinisphaera brasiliensis]|uniref:Teichoic-acid-transporting ATPase n=1 Tax=Rubinisphaera brasiliensis (strain ATCC 49424 / DSM 5305 / JCM 21570 / IAM 15109 / NBRC 103401 / IFAM 1448) TaxID=756272 RepID=F0SI38_RUBBR|nr:ABC transporter ATP-binding protein [Rubinisphaera brasiliensis]ADY61740.1 Teichoic-acid-transporting ATPase [Rubinisphaera brasiliensis DSM 5305]